MPTRDLLKEGAPRGLTKRSRFVAVFQATWFIVNLIARAIQHLPVTTIEVTTVSFVVILFGTAWCWKEKPSDVETTLRLKTSVPIDQILSEVRISIAFLQHVD